MQATVRHFDPGSGAGDVLTDDGAVIEFGPAAFAASKLRGLRLGQRVKLRLDPDGVVTWVTISTLPDPPG